MTYDQAYCGGIGELLITGMEVVYKSINQPLLAPCALSKTYQLLL